jgi:hypothetical protein
MKVIVAPLIILTAFGPGARPVDEATEATRIQGRNRNLPGALRRSSVRPMRDMSSRRTMERHQLMW